MISDIKTIDDINSIDYFFTVISKIYNYKVTLQYVAVKQDGHKFIHKYPCYICNKETKNFFYNGKIKHLFPTTRNTFKPDRFCIDCFNEMIKDIDSYLFKYDLGIL